MVFSPAVDPRTIAGSSSGAIQFPGLHLKSHRFRSPDDASCCKSQKTPKLASKRADISGLTLPNDEDLPAHHPQGASGASIASHVSKKFCPPKTLASFGNGGLTTSLMLMPETTVHEDDLP